MGSRSLSCGQSPARERTDSNAGGHMTIRPTTMGIHHIALRSTNLARSRAFYDDVLGFPVVLDAPNLFICLAGATACAVRGPETATPTDDRFDPFRVGLDHIALACEDAAELSRVAA